jgi:hypothetical protein
MESLLSSFPEQSIYIEYNIAVRHSTAGWQNGEAGCHPALQNALGRDDGKLCGIERLTHYLLELASKRAKEARWTNVSSIAHVQVPESTRICINTLESLIFVRTLFRDFVTCIIKT